jgi:type III secretory pathway component EscU
MVTIFGGMTSTTISSWSLISSLLEIILALFQQFFYLLAVLTDVLMILKVSSFNIMHGIMFALLQVSFDDGFWLIFASVDMKNQFFLFDSVIWIERTLFHDLLLVHLLVYNN